jgi:type II secretory pathway pseudopilin PulG
MSSQRLKSNDSGFTLLEVIIASSLAVTLMLLVWSLFGIYSKLNEKGVRRATELQLVRSLMRQMRSDVHQAISRPRAGGSSSPGRLFDSIPVPSGVQFIGSSTSLQLVVRASRQHQPIPPLDLSDGDETAAPNVYDVVEYDWWPRSSLTDAELPEWEGTLEERGGEGGFGADQRELGKSGLTRRVTPWVLWNASPQGDGTDDGRTGAFDPPQTGESFLISDGRQDLQSLAGAGISEDRVPEVVGMRFRYFDGSVWLSQWDSQTAGRFPAAIEVVFDLQTQGEQAEQEETIGDDLANGETEEASSLILAGDEELPWDVLDEDAEEFAYEYRFVIAIDSAGSLGDPRKRETP